VAVQGKTARSVFLSQDARRALADYLEKERSALLPPVRPAPSGDADYGFPCLAVIVPE